MCINIMYLLQTAKSLPDNTISQIEQGVQASKCNLPHSFEVSEKQMENGKKKYCGAFIIADLCIARAEDAALKKTCKQKTYDQVGSILVIMVTCSCNLDPLLYEPCCEKTSFLHMRKQRRR